MPPIPRGGRQEALVAVARALERLDIWAAAQSMFRRISADHLALRVTWPDVPHMKSREVLLHALRPRVDSPDMAAGNRNP